MYPSRTFCSDFSKHLGQLGHDSRHWFLATQIIGTEHRFFTSVRIVISYTDYEIISILFSGYRTHMLTSPGMENRLKLLALNPALYLGKPSYLLNLLDFFRKLQGTKRCWLRWMSVSVIEGWSQRCPSLQGYQVTLCAMSMIKTVEQQFGGKTHTTEVRFLWDKLCSRELPQVESSDLF